MAVNALDQMLVSGSGIAGPVLGALVYGSLGVAAALALDAACAAIACLCLLVARVPAHRRAPGAPKGVWEEMREGATLVWRDRGVRVLMLVEVAGMALVLPLTNLETLMVHSHFGGDSWAASIVGATFAAGLLAGSGVAMAVTGAPRKVPLVWGAGALMGAALLVCGLLPESGYAAFVALNGIAGAAMGVYAAPILPLVQGRVPEDGLGRAMGVYSSGILLASPVGLAASGAGAEAVGLGPWFVVCGAALVAVHLAAAVNKELRDLDGRAPE